MKTRKKKKKDKKGTIEQENLKRYKERYDKREGVESKGWIERASR